MAFTNPLPKCKRNPLQQAFPSLQTSSMVVSALLDMRLILNFGNDFGPRHRKRALNCTYQDTSTIAVGTSQERTLLKERNIHLEKDNITLPDSQTPFVTALKSSAKKNVSRFHFPGHNTGRAAPSPLTQLIGLGPFLHDLGELPELDGPILEAQKQAARLFGASKTWFLVGGTTCGIQAAVMATCSPGEILILPRNSHISAISGMILSGAVPKYIVPEYDSYWDIAGAITPSQVEKAIKELEIEDRKAAAVFITSPTYHGICSDLCRISAICHSHKIPLIVDEAHGAHLGFHPLLPKSALHQGADLAVQSTHKVLCSLSQSSMLHCSRGCIVDRDRLSKCLQTLQTTSPSNLLLASLDAATAHVSKNPKTVFEKAIELASEAKWGIKKIPGISVLDSSSIDPLRITVGVQGLGLFGYEADDILDRDYGIISELVGTRSITLAFNLGTSREHVDRLVLGLNQLSEACFQGQRTGTGTGTETRMGMDSVPDFGDSEMRLNPREAFFAIKRRKLDIKESIGEICGELICSYPPGIPILVPGEIISERAVDYLMEVKSRGALISGAADPRLSSIIVIISWDKDLSGPNLIGP